MQVSSFGANSRFNFVLTTHLAEKLAPHNAPMSRWVRLRRLPHADIVQFYAGGLFRPTVGACQMTRNLIFPLVQ